MPRKILRKRYLVDLVLELPDFVNNAAQQFLLFAEVLKLYYLRQQ